MKKWLITLLVFTFLGIGFYVFMSSFFSNLGIFGLVCYVVIFALVEIIYLSKVKKIKIFSKKASSVFLITFANIALIFTIFCISDYMRVNNGTAPIFSYHTQNFVSVNVSINSFLDALSPNRKGINYDGIGYKIIVCDSMEEKYHFQFGHKIDYYDTCYQTVSCTKKQTENDEQFLGYDFFDDKLETITTVLTIPADKIESEETYKDEVNKINNIVGCGGEFKKINDTTYKMHQQCFLPKMSDRDINLLYGMNRETLEKQTKKEIINKHSKDDNEMKCE